MQFKVPQNIDLQDRIIGPLTLAQFFYLLFGGLIIYILFNRLFVNGYVFFFFVLALPLGLFSFALAFVRVQDQPFANFVIAFFKYLSQPRARVWGHFSNEVKIKDKASKSTQSKAPPRKDLDITRVNELADILDTRQEPHG